MPKIPGGYYLKARVIQESEIAHAPPHVREIWDWFIKEANHKDNKLNGKTIKRGQCLRSYKDIQEGLKWYVGWRKMMYSKHEIETAMKWLKKRTMVTTMKTTRGMVVTIVNYDTYQDPKNYETYRKPTREPQTSDTINKNVKNDNIVQKEKFNLFWDIFNDKRSKTPALKSWMRIKMDDELFKTIIEGAKRYCVERKAILAKSGTPKMAQGWLTDRRWEDEVKSSEPKYEVVKVQKRV